MSQGYSSRKPKLTPAESANHLAKVTKQSAKNSDQNNSPWRQNAEHQAANLARPTKAEIYERKEVRGAPNRQPHT